MDNKINIFITGGSGYLAVSLANILNFFFKVTLGTRNPHKIKLNHKNIKIKKIDYSKKTLLKCTKGYHTIIHMVGMSSPAASLNKKKSLQVKVQTTNNVISACNKNYIKNLIYISSIKVFKNFDKKNINKENQIKDYKNVYSLSHLTAEKIVLLKTSSNVNIKILRLSNIFGLSKYHETEEVFNNLINNFCYQGITQESIIIKNPNLIRNFLPLSIFAKVIINIVKGNIKKNIKIINLGYKSFNLHEIAKLIKEQIKIIYNKNIIIKTNLKLNKKKNFLYKSKNYNLYYYKKNFLNEIIKILKIFKKINLNKNKL